jgi:hypothetical protein
MAAVTLECGAVNNLLNSPVAILFPYIGITVSSSSCTTSTISITQSGTVFNAVACTGYLSIGNTLSGTGVSPNTVILDQISGAAGGIGTYHVSVPQTVTSTTITASGSGPWLYKEGVFATFQACIDGTAGAQTATVTIECSNDGIHTCATVMGTISLTGTLSASDGFASTSAWKYIRANVTAISGTGAVVTAFLGV